MTRPATDYYKHRTGARARGKLQQIIISNRRDYSGYSGGGLLCACELWDRRQRWLQKRLQSKRKPRTNARPSARARYRLLSNRVSEGVCACIHDVYVWACSRQCVLVWALVRRARRPAADRHAPGVTNLTAGSARMPSRWHACWWQGSAQFHFGATPTRRAFGGGSC